MEIKIHTQDVNLSEDKKRLIERKVEHLTHLATRLADESSRVRVDLAHEKAKSKEEAFSCILTFFVPHATLRAEARASSVENALDETLEKMKPQIERYKAKENHL